MPPVHFIDVSNHQRDVDWRAVAGPQTHGPIAGAWAKASEGRTFRDRYWPANLAGATAAGLAVGAYHYAKPSGGLADAEAEARHFLDVTDNLAGCTLPPVLDLEETRLAPDATTRWAWDWLAAVEDATGVRPIVYLGAYFAVTRPVGWLRWDLWLPAYPSNRPDPDPATLPGPPTAQPWGADGWAAWQYTSTGAVNGVTGRCDRNVARPEWWAQLTRTEEDPPMSAAELAELKAHVTAEANRVAAGTLKAETIGTRARAPMQAYRTPEGVILGLSTDAAGRPVRVGFRSLDRVHALQRAGALPDPIPDVTSPRLLAALNEYPQVPDLED